MLHKPQHPHIPRKMVVGIWCFDSKGADDSVGNAPSQARILSATMAAGEAIYDDLLVYQNRMRWKRLCYTNINTAPPEIGLRMRGLAQEF